MRNLIGLLLAAAALSASAVLPARADQSQGATAAIGGTADPSVPLHQPELRSLLDMPADESFVTQLLLMRGHLRAARALCEAGNQALGAEHGSHPLNELYDDLALQLEVRGLPPFQAELQALDDGIRQGGPASGIAGLFDRANSAIDAMIGSVDGSKRASAGFAARVAAGLLRTAQQEYEVSLADGRIENIVEYQDSWAFYHEARAVVAAAETALAARDAAALADMSAQFQVLAPLWSSFDPAEQPVVDLALAARAADRVDELRQRFM